MSLALQELTSGNEFQPTYEWDQPQIDILSDRLLTERPTQLKDRFVVYELDGNDEFSNLGRAVESKIFDEAFADKADDMQKHYGAYEHASTFFVVMDQKSKQPIGALRIIRNSEAGLKTLNDIAEDELCRFEGVAKKVPIETAMAAHGITDLDKAWDVGTVAVLPEFRTSELKSVVKKNPAPNIMLYRSLYVKAMQEGIEHMVAVIDRKAHNGLKLLGVPFVPIAGSEPFPFSGSTSSTALYGHAPDFFDVMDTRYQRIMEEHPYKAMLLRRSLGQLMLGEHTDDKLLLNK